MVRLEKKKDQLLCCLQMQNDHHTWELTDDQARRFHPLVLVWYDLSDSDKSKQSVALLPSPTDFSIPLRILLEWSGDVCQTGSICTRLLAKFCSIDAGHANCSGPGKMIVQRRRNHKLNNCIKSGTNGSSNCH